MEPDVMDENHIPTRTPDVEPARSDAGEGSDGLGSRGSSPASTFRVSRLTLIYRYLLLVLLTAAGALFLFMLVPMAVSGRDYILGAILALWALALLRYWAFFLAMPHRITVEDDDSLQFHSLLRRRIIPCGEIVALRVSPVYMSYLKIITSRKKTVSMFNHVEGLHDLVLRIKRANPELKTSGC
jgi:hypothetical protein